MRLCAAIILSMLCEAAGAATVFESDGSSMAGWKEQWHSTTSADVVAPVWQAVGGKIKGQAFYSDYLSEDLGGTMFYTNGFRLKVGEVATLTMDFEGKGIPAPDNLNHWWFSFGFRTGGDEPWIDGDVVAYASMRTGAGINLPNGFELWNAWRDSWTKPYPRCEFRSDDTYHSDPITVTYSVPRTEAGFGPSTLIISNHTTGIRCMATSLSEASDNTVSIESNLYFYCQIPARFDWADGLSSLDTSVSLSNVKLTVEEIGKLPSAMPETEVSGAPVLSASEPYARSIMEIKQLSNEAAGKQYSARISGQVLNLHPRQSRVFIHDGTAGLYVELDRRVFEYKGLRAGSEVQFDGVTLVGGYSPIAYTTNLTVTGWSPLPRAHRLDRTVFRATSVDVNWVEVEGRPIAMEYVKSYNHYLITMEVLDTTVEVYVPYQSGAFEMMKPYMFQDVTVQGVLGTTANQHRQMTGRILYVNSIDDFRLKPEITGIVPRPFLMHELMQYGKASTGLVKTMGTVVSASPDTLYLRGEKANLKALIFHEKELSPGDSVELVGYVDVQPVSPSFRTVSVRRIGEGPPPEPIYIQIEENEIDPDWNYDLVSLDAEFVHLEKGFSPNEADVSEGKVTGGATDVLWCRSGERLFEARWPEGIPALSGIRPGSRIRLTGICHVSKTKNPRLDAMAGSLWLELLDENSLTVIRRASWWTAGRLLWTLGFTVSLTLFFLIWAIVLRKVVVRQTQTIGKQIERETTLNERQRIARELHDTLEQSLTALMLQLKRLKRKIEEELPAQLGTVEKAENMLQFCREESRASIQDLRGGILEKMDLKSAVEKNILQLTEGSGIQLSVEMEGEPLRLTLFAEQQLLRLVSEAASNAVQHASPEKIAIQFSYSPDRLVISVCDDGCGFDPAIAESSGRFGLQGMHERANRLHGKLEIQSSAGAGTRIIISMPVKAFIKEESL